MALAVAVALGGLVLVFQPSSSQAPPGAQPAPRGAVNPPDPPPVDPEPWRKAFPLARLEPPAPDSSAPGRALDRALDPYRRGDYQAAASALEGVWIDHPGEHRAALYLGVSRLFIDEVPAAIEVLRLAQVSPVPEVAADAVWYELVGIARLRDPTMAGTEARRVCDAGGLAAPRACAAAIAVGK